MALDLLNLIENSHSESVGSQVLQEIEESLKKVCVILPDVVRLG